MKRVTTTGRTAFAIFALAFAGSATAQQAGAPGNGGAAIALGRDEIAQLARVQLAITTAHDSINARLAKPGNKKDKVQAQLQDTLRAQVAEILHHGGLTDAEFRRRTYIVSTDTAARRIYDSIVVVVTGAPLPGALARGPQLPVPPGPVGVHIGHVVNGFGDTPGLQGLLPTAMGEARIATQHATLAAAQPTNLAYMQTHAGHVIHALDPKLIAAGPGLGYGLKRAATQVALHIEMAASAEGASPAVVTHSKHVAIAARNTVQRADQLLALAQKVQAATSAADAAALVSQMVSLANQLLAGADANGDGRVTIEEGGLQLADEHVRLMLR
jgi:hypothetical protein